MILENKLQTVIAAIGPNHRLQFEPSPSGCRGIGREGSISPDMDMNPESPKIDRDRMVSPYTDRIDVRVVAVRALTFDANGGPNFTLVSDATKSII